MPTRQEGQKVHKLIADGEIFLVAGVYDALSARLAEQAGFHTVVLTGFGVAASLIGEPDFGLLTQSEVLDTARRVCNAVSIPVVVDGDTGYGGALNVMRMVKELIRIGARGTTMHMLDKLMQFDEFTRVVGLEEKYLLDEKFRTKSS